MARRSPARVIGGRLLQALPVILLATFMVFALLKLVPGDIAVTLAGDNATDARITEIRKIYGLDRPFLVQYGAWLATSCRATSRNRCSRAKRSPPPSPAPFPIRS